MGDARAEPVRPRRAGSAPGQADCRFRSSDHRAALAGFAVDRQPRHPEPPPETFRQWWRAPTASGPRHDRRPPRGAGSDPAALAAAPAAPVAVPRHYDRVPAAGPGDAERFTRMVCEYRARVLDVASTGDRGPRSPGCCRPARGWSFHRSARRLGDGTGRRRPTQPKSRSG